MLLPEWRFYTLYNEKINTKLIIPNSLIIGNQSKEITIMRIFREQTILLTAPLLHLKYYFFIFFFFLVKYETYPDAYINQRNRDRG